MPQRCSWVPADDPLYAEYHDREWGVPVRDDRILFEFLILEGAQAGLSWRTILGRRDGYRQAFAQFDPAAVARFTPEDHARLMTDPGIIRNRLKVAGATKNAIGFLAVQAEHGSFATTSGHGPTGRSSSTVLDHRGSYRPAPIFPNNSQPTSRSEAARSSVRRSCMPTCKRWVWWMIMRPIVFVRKIASWFLIEHCPQIPDGQGRLADRRCSSSTHRANSKRS